MKLSGLQHCVNKELQRNWATRNCRKQICVGSPPPWLACIPYAKTLTVSLLFDTKCKSCSWVAAVCSLQCKWSYFDRWQACSCFPVLELWLPVTHLGLLLGCDTAVDPSSCLFFWHELESGKEQELWQLKRAWLCDEQEWILWKTLELDMLQVAKNKGILLPLF